MRRIEAGYVYINVVGVRFTLLRKVKIVTIFLKLPDNFS